MSKTKHVSVEIIFDGTKNAILGNQIIEQQRRIGTRTLSLNECIELFAEDHPSLSKYKEKVSGNSIFIFCIESTFPTPHVCRADDESVMYFCWIEQFHSWYSSYWRIKDTWNVIGAILKI